MNELDKRPATGLIRNALPGDLEAIVRIEARCFPAAEAAGRQQFKERLETFGEHFFVLQVASQVVGFINGMVSDHCLIEDAMYEQAGLHQPTGDWQTVFGLDVLPEFRRQGHAAALLERLIAQAREQGRRGCILTCKQALVPYYTRFGFLRLGVSRSVHGGALWYDMRLTF